VYDAAMATWLHPMVDVIRALSKTRNGRRPQTAGLPPLQRVWLEQITGTPAQLARHEVHVLGKSNSTRATAPAPFGHAPAGVSDGTGKQEAPSHSSPPEGQVMSAPEVINALQRCRYDRSRQIPIAALARAAGLSRETLYAGMNSSKVSKETCAALTPVLREVVAGRLEYRRRARRWEEVEVRRPPNRNLPPQPRLVPGRDYIDGARCRSCGSYSFSPFTSDKVYYACDTCVGPTDRRMLGAQPAEERRHQRASSPHKPARPQRPTRQP
jgi:hypothetical protein